MAIREVCTLSDLHRVRAQEWFTQDTAEAVHAVIRSLDIAVSQEQFDALVAFTFNVGLLRRTFNLAALCQ